MPIYKREPVHHKLPTGWGDMDAVKYTVLNRISGLQHIDNPVVADQNSTYSCKNVYQDSSGSLTVRPALRHLKTITNSELLGVYKTVNDTILHYTKDGHWYLQSDSNFDKNIEIGPGNVTVQESDFVAYALCPDITGKLQLIEWADTVKLAEPVLPVNNPEAPVARRYNLLTSKTKYEAAPVDLDKPENWFDYPAKLGTSSRLFVVSDDEMYGIDQKAGWTTVYKYVRYGVAWNTETFKFSFATDPRDFILVNNTKFDVDSNGNVYVYVIAERSGPSGAIQYVYGKISIKDNRIDTKIIDSGLTEDGFEDYDTLTAYPLRDGICITYLSGEDFDDEYAACTVIRKVGESTEKKVIMSSSPVSGAYTFSTNRRAASLNGIGLLRYFIIGWGYATTFVDLSTGINVFEDTSVQDSSPVIHGTQDFIVTIDKSASEFRLIKPGTGFFKMSFDKLDSDPIVITSGQNVVSMQYDFDDYGKYLVTDFTQLKYFNADGPVMNLAGSICWLSNGVIYRIPKPNYVDAAREISESFPVLSNITDDVVTSFYLDNIYWFVTKHHIFGTGVADEEFTIKYFDPMKYFHFDETITAAIRISDSAFWAFHNNGAYLIYKSSVSMYDETTGSYTDVLTWLCTPTAKSKGCDFENAVVTVPVVNYVSCVTSSDISLVQLYENVQTDERTLVPMTLNFQSFISNLLSSIESVVTSNYKYAALYFLNKQLRDGKTPVMVYDAATESWWYWELPVDFVVQADVTETGVEIIAYANGYYAVYDLFEDYYEYSVGGVTYQIYADRVTDILQPTRIDWYWESALLHFDSIEYRKQLLSTCFTMTDISETAISFDYNFEVYADRYSERSWTPIDNVIERVKTFSYKNIIASFAYLQLYLKNRDGEDYDYTSYTRPKFSTISFKYRLLSGGI